jgi:beta-lactamase regulating signal transducer with metallopeptidase domain
MILAWMISATASGALVTAAATLAERVAGARRLPRRAVWTVAIASTLVAAFLAPHITLGRATEPPSAHAAVDVVTPAATKTFSALDTTLLVLWAAASVTFALMLGVAHWRTTRRLRDFTPSVIAGADVWISDDFGPATIGVLRPHIVVPRWLDTMDAGDRQLVITHEAEHVRAGDALLGLAGVIAAVVTPWNLAVWMQLARLRLAIEVDCDTRVVDRHTSSDKRAALSYGQLLLRVGERAQAIRHPALALAQTRSSLGRRLDALLDRGAPARRRVFALVGVATLLVFSVALVPGPRAGDVLAAIEARPALSSRPIPVAPAIAKASPRAAATAAGVVSRRPTLAKRPRTAGTLALTMPSASVIEPAPPLSLEALRASVRATPLPIVRRRAIMASPVGRFGRADSVRAPTPTTTARPNGNAVVGNAVVRALSAPVKPSARPDSIPPTR